MEHNELRQLSFTFESFLRKNIDKLSKTSYKNGEEILQKINEKQPDVCKLVKHFILENLNNLIKSYIVNSIPSYNYHIGLMLSNIKEIEKYIHVELLDINNLYVLLIISLHKILTTKGKKAQTENEKIIIDNIEKYIKSG